MTTPTTDLFQIRWEHWHRAHEAHRADRHGFLAITGLHWLTEGPQRFPDAPGIWSTGSRGPLVVLADDEELVIDGERVRGEYGFGVLPERSEVLVGWGDAVIEVAKRGGHDIVRPRHPDHPTLVHYAGTAAYPPDPAWAVPGRFIAFASPEPTTVGSVAEGLEHVYDAIGRVEFEAGGRDLSLIVFPGRTPGTLLALFTDQTSGVTTYPANRSVVVDPPDAGGRVTLDFNRATNLPCAYTEFATCPLPPPQNRLPIAVEAGEKIPGTR